MAYEVVLLVEAPVTDWDARQIVTLHQDVDDVHYRVLLPVEDAAPRVEAAVSALSSPAIDGVPVHVGPDDLDDVGQELLARCHAALSSSLAAFAAHGAQADGELTTSDPLQRLSTVVGDDAPAEVIVLTRPHIVADTLHLDWASRARRHLDVPVLHLLAQTEPDWETVAERDEAAQAGPDNAG